MGSLGLYGRFFALGGKKGRKGRKKRKKKGRRKEEESKIDDKIDGNIHTTD